MLWVSLDVERPPFFNFGPLSSNSANGRFRDAFVVTVIGLPLLLLEGVDLGVLLGLPAEKYKQWSYQI